MKMISYRSACQVLDFLSNSPLSRVNLCRILGEAVRLLQIDEPLAEQGGALHRVAQAFLGRETTSSLSDLDGLS